MDTVPPWAADAAELGAWQRVERKRLLERVGSSVCASCPSPSVQRICVAADRTVKATFGDSQTLVISPDGGAFEVFGPDGQKRGRHLTGTCTSQHAFMLASAMRVRNVYVPHPAYCRALDEGDAVFTLGHPCTWATFPRSLSEATELGQLVVDAVHGVRLVSTDRTVAVTLHPTLLVLRATYPLRLNRSEAPWNPQPPTLRHHYAWVTQEFPSTAVPEWLQGALALCVIAACEAGLVPSPALEPHQDTTPSPKDSLSSIQHFLARWAPGALAASPRFVELPTCQATYSRAAPPGAPADRATVTADTNGEALSSWPGHPSGSWWASPATVTWPGDAVLVAEWTPQGTQLLVPVPSSDLGDHGQGEVGPDAMQAPVVGGSSTTGGVEALTVMHEDGSLLLTSGAGRYVLHVPPGESRPRLHLSNALPDRVATGAPVLGDTFAGVGPRWADLDDEGSSEGVRMRQGTVALGPCASRLLALRGVAESAIRLTESTTKRPSRYSGSIHDTPGPSSYGGTASGRERWVMAGDAYVEAARFPSAFVEHPVAGRKVAYHRPGGGPLGYPGPWHGVAGAGGDERVAPASEAQAKGYFSSAGSYRERYEMGKDEGVVEMGFDPAVGHFTAFADGRVQVRFVDAAVAWVEPDGVLCRVVLPGGGPPRAVSTARPIGVEAYVTAAMEFRGWALQGPTGRAAALRAQRAVAAELSRIQRQVAIVQSGWRPS